MPISLSLFATVFGVIFVAELPDKTAVAALMLATRHRATPVFLGAALALATQSAIAVAAGSLLARLPSAVIHIGTGVLFLGCALLMWFRKPEEEAHGAGSQEKASFWKVFATVFAVVFMAELGDLTQIGTAGFAAKYHAWLTVFVGSTLALWSVALVVVVVGNRAGKLLDPKLTQRVAAVVFGLLGALLLVGVV